MCSMSQNSFSAHQSFDSVLLTVITFSAVVEELAKISLVREELAAAFLFVSSFMTFHIDFEFRFELVRS